MTSAALELQGVSRRFGGLHAVQDLSLVAPPGRVTGLIGPNGAGKSTVVNLITGLLSLTAGSVRYGEDIGRLPPHQVARRGIARTFQNIRLLAEASVLDNVIAGLYRHDRTGVLAQCLGLPSVRRQEAEWRDRASSLLEEFGLGYARDQRCGSLPYGHQRLVEIVRALMMEPSALLLDEPVAGMNDVEANQLSERIRSLADRGLVVLLIEHNMRFVMGLCDTIHVVSSGKLVMSGTPAEVRSHPEVIEAYLGA
jgi:branched-chain amino acid transport system ATP-binding protein